MKIVIFGDSIAKGLNLSKDDLSIRRLNFGFASLLEKEYDVTNHSMFGQTLKRASDKKLFERAIFEKESAKEKEEAKKQNSKEDAEKNIAIIELGGNDADFVWEDVCASPEEFHISKTEPKEFSEILTKTMQSLQNAGFKVFVCSLFPINSKRYFDNVLTKKYDGEKILLFLKGDRENLYRHQESYNNILSKCVAEANATLIDFRSPLLLKTNFLEYLSDDGIHPNEKGQEFIFREINKTIKEKG